MAYLQIFLLLITLIAAAGCEGDTIYVVDNVDIITPDGSTPDGTVDGSTDEDIVIGLWAPNAPPFLGPLNRAVQLAADEVNSSGGLLGNRNVVVEYVEESQGETDVGKFRQLIEAGAVGIIGPFGNFVILQALEVAAESETPFFSLFGGLQALFPSASEEAGSWGRSTNQLEIFSYGDEIVETVKDQGCTEVGLITGESFEVERETYISAWMKKIEDSGLVLNGIAELDAMGADGTAALSVFEGGNMPGCFILYSDVMGFALRDAPDGYADATHILFGDQPNPGVLAAVEDASAYDGSIGLSARALNVERNRVYVDLYEAAFGDALDPVVHIYMAPHYDYAAVLLLAIEAAGTTEGKAVRDAIAEVGASDGEVTIIPGELAQGLAALRAGQTINYEGASGTADFSEGPVAVSSGVDCYTIESANELNLGSCE